MDDKFWKQQEREFWRALEQQAPDHAHHVQYRAHRLASEFKSLSKNQRRDFDYYLSRGRKEKCFPQFRAPPSKDCLVLVAATAPQWYWLWDTHGVECGCEEAEDAGAIVQAKAFLNLSIKMWVEDLTGGLIAHMSSPQDFDLDALPWVRKAFEEQLRKSFLNHPSWGFIPTFAQKFLTT